MNPELQRLLWLNISPLRLVLVPAIVGLFLVAAGASEVDKLPYIAAMAATVMFALFTVAGGGYSSATAVSDEWQDDTWDQQRMSALTPWTMTWGKLLGATVFHWYGGLIFLGLMAWGLLDHGLSGVVTLMGMATASLFALFAHAINLAASTQFSSAMPRRLLWVLPLLLFVLFQSTTNAFIADSVAQSRWWSFEVSAPLNVMASVALAAACAVLAAWRTMAQALAVPQWPWGMPALVVVISLYSLGYASNVTGSDIASMIVALALTFAMSSAITEAHSRSHWQRLLNQFRQGRIDKAIKALPVWPLMLAMGAIAATFQILIASPDSSFTTRAEWPLSLGWTGVLLVARDCAVALIFAFAPQARRARLAFVTYLVAVWALLPWLLTAVTNQALPVEWVLPVAGKSAGATLAAAIHCSVAVGLLVMRWKDTRPSSGDTDDAGARTASS